MSFLEILKTVSPWIGAALGSPLAGLAIDAATGALGASGKTTDALKQALSGATPEQMLALKKADQDFALLMQSLGFKQVADLEALAAGDRKDAREMQVSTHSRMPAFLSSLVTIGYFGVLMGMMAGWLKVSDSQALLLMLGSLGTAWGCTISFWFGTTRASSEKNAMLAQSAPAK